MMATTTNDSNVWGGRWFVPAAASLGLGALTLLLSIILRAAKPDGGFGEILTDLTNGLMGVGWGLAILSLIVLAFAIIRRQDDDRGRFAPLADGQWMVIGAMVLLVLGAALMP